MTLLLNDMTSRLAAAGIESPRLEARLLLGAACGISADEAVLLRRELTAGERERLDSMLRERLAHKPMDKILGRRGFYKYEFNVSEKVLLPRPDTEIIVEQALKLLDGAITQNIADFGTGSGCILLSLLAENKLWHGQGIDRSAEALQIAAQNARELGLEAQVSWLNASWFDDNLASALRLPLDMLVSNPPYIPVADIPALAPEVKDYDPLSALDGGADGLDHYRQIASLAPALLKTGGWVVLEVGVGQAEDVSRIFAGSGLQPFKIVPDLAGIDRCVILKK